MRLRRKVGQLMMAGFEGLTPSKEIETLIREWDLGGVILFSRNIESPAQCAELCATLQGFAEDAPLLIAIDQEGGRVSRLPPPFTQFPSARDIGRCNSVMLTYQCGEAIAKELSTVGINMNFAPVLDLDTNPNNPVIGDRSFGERPNLVQKHAVAMIGSMLDQKVIPCGKHFPGHGDTDLDSHEALPHIRHRIKTLTDRELKPFIHAIENRLPAVMSAHVCCHAFDNERPASLSKKVISELLRKAIEFDGLVVTDDLEMKGITNSHSVAEAAVHAVDAGSDLVLVCHSPKEQMAVLERLLKSVNEKNGISEKRLDQSLNRILSLKEDFLLPRKNLDPEDIQEEIDEVIGCSAHRRLIETIEKTATKKNHAKNRTD